MADSGVHGHMPEHLREYWVHGKGAAKIRWGAPHDFNRCVRQLRKYFPTNPKGLCNILHRAALGVAPGQEHATAQEVPTMTDLAELATGAADERPDVDMCPDGQEMDENGNCVETDLDEEFTAMLPKFEGWRGPVAPIEQPTGDGRVMGRGALSTRTLPVPLLWQKTTGEGHKGSIIVGSALGITVGDREVYAYGKWFDTPEAQEAKKLVDEKVIGPSVDLDQFKFEQRVTGSGEKFDAEAHCPDGECAEQQAYVTSGRISGITLVPIAAFDRGSQVGIENFTTVDEDLVAELLADGEFTADDDAQAVDGDCGCSDKIKRSLVSAVRQRPGAEVFARYEAGRLGRFGQEGERIFGYIADKSTCHVSYRNSCRTVPRETDYSLFHRYPVEVDGGLVMAGRFTVGHGRFQSSSCHHPAPLCNADDHACSYLSAAETIAHYDQLDTVALVQCGFDDRGIWYSGVWADGSDAAGQSVVAHQGVSGDWRDAAGQLRLIDVMGVSTTRPAFPVAAFGAAGMMSLVAALPPEHDELVLSGDDFVARMARMTANTIIQDRANQARLRESVRFFQGRAAARQRRAADAVADLQGR